MKFISINNTSYNNEYFSSIKKEDHESLFYITYIDIAGNCRKEVFTTREARDEKFNQLISD